MKIIVSLFCIVITLTSSAQKMYPTHWWVGMQNPNLQLMIHGEKIADKIPMIKMTAEGMKLDDGVILKKIIRVENPNYIFLDLVISNDAKAGEKMFRFGNGKNAISLSYTLKEKSKEDGKSRIQGVHQSDLIYLLMPDRFANGDTKNDKYNDMLDKESDRQNPFDRHGGDLQGIEKNLDYLSELGVTAIWPTPVVENDMQRTMEGGTSRSTYHGYAFTDHYNIDKRLGGNEAYKKLVNAAHAKGIKFIQDAVYNHVGNDHWFIRDLPEVDWINQWPTYTHTSYREQPMYDPHASQIDRSMSVNGWFTPFLVDLNQRNPRVSKFLIQHAIWSTEEFGIDGWRIDTYFYSDSTFLNDINQALFTEFPALTIFGETLVNTTISAAYYANNTIDASFKHNCRGITDAPLTYAMLDGIRQPFGWSEGVNRIYNTLAQDFLYKDATLNCIFLDNHDLDRVYSIANENFDKYKMAINWLLTMRGIPQLYYGTEILMKNFKNPTDAEVRKDFPGGWPGDAENKFTKAGRNVKEQEAFQFVSSLAQFRKKSSAIGNGKLMQYLPKDGLYVYFRYDDKQTVMVIANTGDKTIKPDWKHFSERVSGFTKAKNVQTNQTTGLIDFEIKPWESFVLELLH